MGEMVFKGGDSAVRKSIRQKRDPQMQLLREYGEMFLKEDPGRNIIPYNEFTRFIPLFNKAQFSKMDKDQVKNLYYEWSQRVNLQLPVFVIDTQTLDPQGKPYPANNPDAKTYKVIYALPPAYRALNPINKLGGNVIQLAAEYLAGARQSSNPFDNRGEYYSGELAKILATANKENLEQKSEEFKKLEAGILHKGSEQPKPAEAPKEENPSGLKEGEEDPAGSGFDFGDDV